MKKKKMSTGLVWLIVAAIGLSILGCGWFTVYRHRSNFTTSIEKDLTTLKEIIERINKTCRITSFDSLKTSINFLNVESFSGSEVGGMNLANPKKWEGPYLKENPKIEGVEYQIVHTRDGEFITPGDGVRLPNKKVIGTDILFDEGVDIEKMMADKNLLQKDGKSFVIKLNFNTALMNAAQEYIIDDAF